MFLLYAIGAGIGYLSIGAFLAGYGNNSHSRPTASDVEDEFLIVFFWPLGILLWLPRQMYKLGSRIRIAKQGDNKKRIELESIEEEIDNWLDNDADDDDEDSEQEQFGE